VSAGTGGAGTATQIGALSFQKETGTSFALVAYRGAGPAMQGLVSGQIDLMFDQLSNSLPQVKGGQIRAFAVMSPKRAASAPDIPTVDEAGMPGLYLPVWHGLWAPRALPAELVAKLNSAVVEALTDEVVRKRFTELGQEIPSKEQLSPSAFANYYKAEIEKWWPIVRSANLKPQ
jgi:tripartite-type tricarboxylate transporter receptor subunit TctC